MSLFINKSTIAGNLGRDPEVRTFPSGDKVATLSVGYTESWKDKDSGEWVNKTDWFRVVVRGNSFVEYVERTFTVGDNVYVEGLFKHRTYQQDGQDRTVCELHAFEIKKIPRAANRTQGSEGIPEGSDFTPGQSKAAAPAKSANAAKPQRSTRSPKPQQANAAKGNSAQAPDHDGYGEDAFSSPPSSRMVF